MFIIIKNDNSNIIFKETKCKLMMISYTLYNFIFILNYVLMEENKVYI
jgi:hypothetical protein